MKLKNQTKIIIIFITSFVVLLAALLIMVFNGCFKIRSNISESTYTPISAKRNISESFDAISPSVTYDMMDIGIDKSGFLYVADKDKIIKINTEHEEREWIKGLDFCKKILLCDNKILILDQGNGNSLLKVYDLEGSLLKEAELQANVIKMQTLDKAGNKLALHIIDDNQKSLMAVFDVKSENLRTLDFLDGMGNLDIVCFCSYSENKLCVITLKNRYMIMLYDTANDKITKFLDLNIQGITDVAYNGKNKTFYYLSSLDIGSINLDTGITQAIKKLDGKDKLYTRIETYGDILYVMEVKNEDGRNELFCFNLSNIFVLPNHNKTLNVLSTTGDILWVLRESEEKFIEDNPGVQISYSTLNVSLPDAKVKIMAGDLEMDIISVHSIILYDLISSGVLTDLTKYCDIVSIMTHEDILDGLYDFSTVDGFFFGAPLYYFGGSVLKVNTHLKDKLSVDLPDANWNWHDFYDYAKQVRRDLDGDGIKDTYIMKANKYHPLFLDAYCCKHVNKVSGKADFNNDMFVDLLSLWKKMWDEDLIKAAANPRSEDETVLFTIKSAGYNMGKDEYTYISALSQELKVYPSEAQFLCVSSAAKNTELAVKFLAKWMSKEVYTLRLPLNGYFYKDFSLCGQKDPFNPNIILPNEVNEQIIKNITKHSVPITYPVDLRIYITLEIMPKFMIGEITATEAAVKIQSKADMMIME